jgi:ATP-dependent protease ClpP protease subunit
MQERTINIYGGIEPYDPNQPSEGRVSVADVRKQLLGIKAGDNLTVNIDSLGGDVDEGFAIMNTLKSTGANIVTRNVGRCCSIATIVLLAGQKIEALPNSSFMVHPSWIEYPKGNAEKLKEMAAHLQICDRRMLNAYKTARPKFYNSDKFNALFKGEKTFTAQDAKRMGLVDTLTDGVMQTVQGATQLRAYAYYQPKTQSKMSDEKNLKSWFKGFVKALVADTDTKAAMVDATLADGTPIVIESESGMLEPSAIVKFADGEFAPEGNHTLADGTMFTLGTDGVCLDVKQPEMEVEALKTELAQAKAELLTLKAKALEDAEIVSEVIALRNTFKAMANGNPAPKPQAQGTAAPVSKTGFSLPEGIHSQFKNK